MLIEPNQDMINQVKPDAELALQREKYFDHEFKDFFENKSFDELQTFLGGVARREGLSKEFLIKANLLTVSLDSDSVETTKLRDQTTELVKLSRLYIKRGGVWDSELDNSLGESLSRFLRSRAEYNEVYREDFTVLESTELVIDLAFLISEVGVAANLAEDCLLKMMSGSNFSDRWVGLDTMFDIGGDRNIDTQKTVFVTKLFRTMKPEDSLEIADSMNGYICGQWVEKQEIGIRMAYWDAFADYCKKMESEGYETDDLIQGLYNDYELKYELSPKLLEYMDQHEKEVKLSVLSQANIENIWFELCGNYELDKIETFLKEIRMDDSEEFSKSELRYLYLQEKLPGESETVCKLLAQILTANIASLYGDNNWSSWIKFREIEWREVLSSPAVRLVWDKIKSSPVTFAYQIAFWLANFPTKSLQGFEIDHLDIVEGVELSTGISSLCADADRFMMESLNVNKVVVLAEGKLLLKRRGIEVALCTEDFVAVSKKGEKKIFKRGCYYSPSKSYSFWGSKPLEELDLGGSWGFDRVARSSVVPRATDNLLHLADLWLVKHGYKETIE